MKSLIKHTAVFLTVAALACAPLVANPANHFNYYDEYNNCGPMHWDDHRGPGMGMRMGPGMGPRFMNGNPEQKSIMGTVSSVNTDKGIVTIKNTDGNEIQIHVNPLTRIFKDESPLPPPDQNTNNTNKATPNRRPGDTSLQDIKAGDFVVASSFNTDTKILEAATIFIPGVRE